MRETLRFPTAETQVLTLEEILAETGERIQDMEVDDPLELKFMLALTSEDTTEAERLLSILERKAALGLTVITGGHGTGRGMPARGR